MMSLTSTLATNAEPTRNVNDVGDKYIINIKRANSQFGNIISVCYFMDGAVFLFYFQISLIHKRTLPNVTPDIMICFRKGFK